MDRDKSVLSIYRLKGESLEESDNLSDPSVLTQKNRCPSTGFARDDPELGLTPRCSQRRGVEDLEAALEQFGESPLIGS